MNITSIDANIVIALEQSVEKLHDNTYRQSLTDMLRRNGPLQTIAFLTSKDGTQPLLAALKVGLEAIPGHPRIALDVCSLARLATGDLLALSQRLTRVAVWINRLAEAAPPKPEKAMPV